MSILIFMASTDQTLSNKQPENVAINLCVVDRHSSNYHNRKREYSVINTHYPREN